MAIQILGQDTTSILAVESGTKAARVTLRPIDYGSLGIYSIGVSTGAIAAASGAGSEIYQFRWTDATRLAVVQYILISAGNTATAFTAGVCTFDAIVSRSWSADGTGGTAATLTAHNQKLRNTMASSIAGISGTSRVASGTTALGAGTKSFDSQAFAVVSGSVVATAGTPLIPPTILLNALTGGEYPLVLAANEGFSIRSTVPATGTWTASISVKWAELTSY